MSTQLSGRKTGGGLLFSSEALKDLLGSKGPAAKKKKPVSSTSTTESARRSDDLIRDILREETGSINSARFIRVVKKQKLKKDKTGKPPSKASRKARAALLYGGAGSGDEAIDITSNMGVRENARAMRAASNSVQSYASLLGVHSDDVLYLERQYWQVHKIVAARENKLKDAYDQLVGDHEDFNESDARLLMAFAGVPVDDRTYHEICASAAVHAASRLSAAQATAVAAGAFNNTTSDVNIKTSPELAATTTATATALSRKSSISARPDSTGGLLNDDEPAAFSVTVNGGEAVLQEVVDVDEEEDDRMFVNPLGDDLDRQHNRRTVAAKREGLRQDDSDIDDPIETMRNLRGSANNVESPTQQQTQSPQHQHDDVDVLMNFKIWLSGLMWHLRQRLMTCVLGERYGHTLPQFLEKVEIGEALAQPSSIDGDSSAMMMNHSSMVGRSEEMFSLADHMGVVDEGADDEYLGVGEGHFGSVDESQLLPPSQRGSMGMATAGNLTGGDISSRHKRPYPGGPAVDDFQQASSSIGVGNMQQQHRSSSTDNTSSNNNKAAGFYASTTMSRSIQGAAVSLPPVKLHQLQVEDAKRRLVDRAGFDSSLGRDTPRCLKLGVQAPPSGALVDPKGMIATVEALRKELQVSQAGMSLINTRMEENIAWVRSNCEMPEGMTISTRTRDRCRAIALERLFAVLTGCIQTRQLRTLSRWKSFCHFDRLHGVAKKFARAKSLQLLSHALFEAVCRQYLRALQPWRSLVRREKRREQNVASMEIQRIIRGFLGRVRVQKIHLHYAAVEIQCLARRKKARKAVQLKRDRAKKLRMFAAALIIQHLFKGLVRVREAKKEIERRKMNRATTKIQRIARGNIGRANFKRIKEETIRREKRRLARLKKEEDAKKLRWQQLQEKRAKEKADAAAAKAEKEKKVKDAANAKAEALLAARQAALAKAEASAAAANVGDAIAQAAAEAAERRRIKAQALEDAKREQEQQENEAGAGPHVAAATEAFPNRVYDPPSTEHAAKAAIKLQSLTRGRSVRLKRQELARKRDEDHSRLMGTSKPTNNSNKDHNNKNGALSSSSGKKRMQSPSQAGGKDGASSPSKRPLSGPLTASASADDSGRAPSRGGVKPHPPAGPPGVSPPGSAQGHSRLPGGAGSPPGSSQKPRPPPLNRGASSPQKRPSIHVNTTTGSPTQGGSRSQTTKTQSPKKSASTSNLSPTAKKTTTASPKNGGKTAASNTKEEEEAVAAAVGQLEGTQSSEFITKDDLKIPGFEDAVASFREKTKPAIDYKVVGESHPGSRSSSRSPSRAGSRPSSAVKPPPSGPGSRPGSGVNKNTGSRPSSAARQQAGAGPGSRPGSAAKKGTTPGSRPTSGAAGYGQEADNQKQRNRHNNAGSSSRPSSAARKTHSSSSSSSGRPSSASRSREEEQGAGANKQPSRSTSLLMTESSQYPFLPAIGTVTGKESLSLLEDQSSQESSEKVVDEHHQQHHLPAIQEGSDVQLGGGSSISAESSLVEGEVAEQPPAESSISLSPEEEPPSFKKDESAAAGGGVEEGEEGLSAQLLEADDSVEEGDATEFQAHVAASESAAHVGTSPGEAENEIMAAVEDKEVIIAKRRAAEQRRVAEEKVKVESMIAAEQRAEDEKKRRDDERQRALDEAENKKRVEAEKKKAEAEKKKAAANKAVDKPLSQSQSSSPAKTPSKGAVAAPAQSPDRPSSRGGFSDVLGALFGGSHHRPASSSAQSRIPQNIPEGRPGGERLQPPPRPPISRDHAAAMLIARARIFLAKRRALKKKDIIMKTQKRAGLLLWWAVVSMQRIVRGKQGRARFDRQKIKRKEELIRKKLLSAITIQKVVRGFLGRRRVLRMREAEKKKQQNRKMMAYARGEIELDGTAKKKKKSRRDKKDSKSNGRDKAEKKKHSEGTTGEEGVDDADDEHDSEEDEDEIDPEEAARNRKKTKEEKEHEAEAGQQLQEKLKKVDDIDTVKESAEEQRKQIEEQSKLIQKLLEETEKTKRKLEEIERLKIEESADFAARQEMLAMAAGPINSAYNSLGPGANTGRPPRSNRSTSRQASAPPSARSARSSAKDGSPKPAEGAAAITVNGQLWTQLWDADAKRYYWWCDATEKSQWEKPTDGGAEDSGYDTDAVSVMTDYTTDNYDSGADYADSEFGGGDGDIEWQEYWDEQAQAKYWYNNLTGEASWTKPEGTRTDDAPMLSKASARILENPDDWVSYIDDTTGQEYWYNAKTGESSWA